MAHPLDVITGTVLTRPADTTAYAVGDIVANSTTAGSVVPIQFNGLAGDRPGRVLAAKIYKSGTNVTNANFRVHLYNQTPASITNGDNGAMLTSIAGYIGHFDVSVVHDFTNGAYGDSASDFPRILDANGSLYGLIEALGAYTPASAETFTVKLDIQRASAFA